MSAQLPFAAPRSVEETPKQKKNKFKNGHNGAGVQGWSGGGGGAVHAGTCSPRAASVPPRDRR